jgi:hypothetical protein
VSGVVARIRRRLGEIRPVPARAPINRRAVYGSGLLGVAGLIGLAWVNNAGALAVAALVALIIGLLWVAFMAHRAVVTTALAIAWWITAAPAIGVIASLSVAPADIDSAVPQATTTNVSLGVVVWLAAVLTRAPRPATTIMACWAMNLATVLLAGFVVPAQAWLVGYLVTALALAYRNGLLARLGMRRDRRGAADPDDPTQSAVRAAMDALPPGYAIRYAAPERDGDAAFIVVAGPTGTFAVVSVTAVDQVAAVSNGTRLAAGPRRLDRDIRAAAQAAVRAGALLRTPVQPVLLVTGAPFPDGLARMAVRPTARAEPIEVIVVRDDLAAGRLSYGCPVLTAGQIARLDRRTCAWGR